MPVSNKRNYGISKELKYKEIRKKLMETWELKHVTEARDAIDGFSGKMQRTEESENLKVERNKVSSSTNRGNLCFGNKKRMDIRNLWYYNKRSDICDGKVPERAGLKEYSNK